MEYIDNRVAAVEIDCKPTNLPTCYFVIETNTKLVLQEQRQYSESIVVLGADV